MTSNIDARPILFSGPMVRALLDGRKTQTRRLAWGKPFESGPSFKSDWQEVSHDGPGVYFQKPTPWLKMHRRFEEAALRSDVQHYREWLYVREGGAFTVGTSAIDGTRCYFRQYRADGEPASFMGKWKPSIHMPRWASRLTLEVTGTKLERLQDISDADAEAEGVVFETADPPFFYVPGIMPHSLTAIEIPDGAAACFAKLWNILHTKPGERWEDNPEVVVPMWTPEGIHHRNIDRDAA